MIWLCVLISVSVLVFVGQLRFKLARMRWLVPTSAAAPPEARLTVIMPARNEESCLERCVRSILDQREVDLEILIVNDHSTDRTGAIADALAREDGRVRVIHDPPVEPGWLGKPNAMQTALRAARSELILFSDADIVHYPGTIAMGCAEMRRRGLGLVSFMPSFEFHGLWEHALLPGYVGWMGFALSRAVEDPKKKAAVAAGAFILVRAAALRDAGGLESIRRELLDDVALARVFKERGIPVGFYLAPELLRVRLFKNGHEAFWGTTKNILAAAPGGLLGILALAPATVVCYATPPVAAGVALMTRDAWLAGAAVLAFASQYAGMILFRRFLHFAPLRLLFLPLTPIPLICCIGRALYHRWVHGAVWWRGRSLRVD